MPSNSAIATHSQNCRGEIDRSTWFLFGNAKSKRCCMRCFAAPPAAAAPEIHWICNKFQRKAWSIRITELSFATISMSESNPKFHGVCEKHAMSGHSMKIDFGTTARSIVFALSEPNGPRTPWSQGWQRLPQPTLEWQRQEKAHRDHRDAWSPWLISKRAWMKTPNLRSENEHTQR